MGRISRARTCSHLNCSAANMRAARWRRSGHSTTTQAARHAGTQTVAHRCCFARRPTPKRCWIRRMDVVVHAPSSTPRIHVGWPGQMPHVTGVTTGRNRVPPWVFPTSRAHHHLISRRSGATRPTFALSLDTRLPDTKYLTTYCIIRLGCRQALTHRPDLT